MRRPLSTRRRAAHALGPAWCLPDPLLAAPQVLQKSELLLLALNGAAPEAGAPVAAPEASSAARAGGSGAMLTVHSSVRARRISCMESARARSISDRRALRLPRSMSHWSDEKSGMGRMMGKKWWAMSVAIGVVGVWYRMPWEGLST